MTDGQEFLPTAKVTYEVNGLQYWITVNEYGAADVRCFEGRGEKWRIRVRPGKTLRESWLIMPGIEIDELWVNRLDAVIADLRGLVGA